MAVPLKTITIFVMFITFSVLNSLSTVRDLNSSKDVSVLTPIMVDENIVINILRKGREVIRGRGCPKGKIFYFNGCRAFKE